MAAPKKAKPSIFKVRATAAKPKTSKAKATVIDPGTDELRDAVDQYSSLKGQIKNLEGELTIHEDALRGYAEETYAERNMDKNKGNFKIKGVDSVVNYIVAKRGLVKDLAKYEDFSNQYGEEAAERLLEPDYGSIRLNAEFLAEGDNQEKLDKALSKLGQEFLDQIFTSPTYKIKDDVLDGIAEVSETPDEYRSILKELLVKPSIRT